MNIDIKELRKEDFNIARKFSVEGMHLNWYATSKVKLFFYSKYFWYLEITKATKAIGAYMDNKLVGVLLVDIKDEPKIYKSFWGKLYVKITNFIINLFYENASSTYNETTSKMLKAFSDGVCPDGEINFFAVDPAIKGKGIGTLLLNELERLEKGKHIYLYTDSGSTYQFYLRRGFEESGKTDITLEINKKEVSLTCFLFSKKL